MLSVVYGEFFLLDFLFALSPPSTAWAAAAAAAAAWAAAASAATAWCMFRNGLEKTEAAAAAVAAASVVAAAMLDAVDSDVESDRPPDCFRDPILPSPLAGSKLRRGLNRSAELGSIPAAAAAAAATAAAAAESAAADLGITQSWAVFRWLFILSGLENSF